MSRIRWYGPSLVVLLSLVGLMVFGPQVIWRLGHAKEATRIEQIRADLKTSPFLSDLSQTFRDVASSVRPSVVHIAVYGRDGISGSAGSGWVYDADGHIITNQHVIAGAARVDVRFYDGSQYRAKLVGADASTDIAVLKVDAKAVHPALRVQTDPAIPDAHGLEQGEVVFAFGSPFNTFDFSVSQGVVSATGRVIRGVDGRTDPGGYQNFIQTDAAINPGNSGGPLTNVYGEVVGMNTAIVGAGKIPGEGTFVGLGFAIPVFIIERIADQIIADIEIEAGFIGIRMKNDEEASVLMRSRGFTGRGVMVDGLPGRDEPTPAQVAGVRVHDIITAVDGRPVRSMYELRALVGTLPPGSLVRVEIWRPGQSPADEPADDSQPGSASGHLVELEIQLAGQDRLAPRR